jgi:uncharacterized protein (TIGR03437 family)
MNPAVSRTNPGWKWAVCLVAFAGAAGAQVRLDWRPIGNTQILHATQDVASGPISRVWFDGADLFVRTATGRVMRFDGESGWSASDAEVGSGQTSLGARRYRADGHVLRSDDGGQTWSNLTLFQGHSILGGVISDVAIAPSTPDEVVAVGQTGVWRSMDGGRTWAGLNEGLPNLPLRRILGVPGDGEGIRVETDREVLEWKPGQRKGWVRIAGVTGNPGVVSAARGEYVYVGFPDGRVLAARQGSTRPPVSVTDSPIAAIWSDPAEPSTAIAAAGNRLYRTFNGGGFWDDITGSLDGGRLFGVTADRNSRAVYVATERGVAYGRFEFAALGETYSWQWLTGASLPNEAARDVRLDAGANQLFVALEASGVYAAMAPHRRDLPAIARAADGSPGPASPGALLRLIGRGLTLAESVGRSLPVLAAIEDETQLQIPFDAEGAVLPMSFGSGTATLQFEVPLQPVSPGIFEDRDGSPMLLDADSGVMLDAMKPARPSMRVQILAAGLGRVRPDWPAGTPAPLDDPPSVVAPVRVMLDGQRIDADRATLAPGYAGFYLVEFEMPAVLNAGTAEIYLEVAGQFSNRVRVYIEP